jgi:hypothetical protein
VELHRVRQHGDEVVLERQLGDAALMIGARLLEMVPGRLRVELPRPGQQALCGRVVTVVERGDAAQRQGEGMVRPLGTPRKKVEWRDGS